MTKKEILTEVNNNLPANFDQLEPQLKLHFLIKSTTDCLEKNCGLTGNWILVNGDMTLFDLLKDKKN